MLALKVELVLRQGHTTEIENLMKGVNFTPYPPLWFFFLPHVTELKALMALGRADKLEDASCTNRISSRNLDCRVAI